MNIRPTTKNDKTLIRELMEKYWGGEPLIVHGRDYYPSALEGLFLFEQNDLQGFLFYDQKKTCSEIIVFEVLKKFHGLGTHLLKTFIEKSKGDGCKKIVVMTTNDNIDALRFYQRRGFIISGIIINALEKARKLKPKIPEIGDYSIPLRDEILLEYEITEV